ncbi:hypothetical protein MHYP_G00289800 [Metynnis hypsauchen]
MNKPRDSELDGEQRRDRKRPDRWSCRNENLSFVSVPLWTADSREGAESRLLTKAEPPRRVQPALRSEKPC